MIYARTSAYSDDPKFPSSIGWDRLDNKRWTELYRSPFVPGYGDLRLVVTDLAFWLNISGTHDQGISFHLFANKSEPSFEKWSCWKLPRLITNNGVNLSVDLNPTGSNFTSILDEYSVAMNVARLEAFALEEFILPARKTVRINEGQSAFRVVDEVCPDKACQVSGCQETGWLVNHPLRVGWALAKPSSRFSKVQIGSHFMLVVIFANLAKVGAIYWTLRSCKGGHIMTIGDAIASYLENPEKEYWGRCTLTRNELLHNLDNKIRPWRNKHTHIIWLLGRSSLRSGLLL